MTSHSQTTISRLMLGGGIAAAMVIIGLAGGPATSGTVIGKVTYNWTKDQFISNCSALKVDVRCDAQKGLCTCDDGTFIYIWHDPAINPQMAPVVRMPSPGGGGGGGAAAPSGGRSAAGKP